MPLDGMHLGRYRLVRQLGSGGMGEVYLAEDTRINRQVAVKIVRSELTAYPETNDKEDAARLFEREMKAISHLDHPRILPLYDYGEAVTGGTTTTYMVMPYRPEGSLADWIRQRTGPRLTLEEVGALIRQAAEALQHAHDRQIVHQDVKPSNFLVQTTNAQVGIPDLLLADFGIAKSTSTSSSMSQNVRGTPSYMAPEQWDGQPVVATDQYALAIMAYLLLTGKAPFQGGPGQVMRQHMFNQPMPPSRIDGRIPPALDAVILRALAKQPEERYPSILEFARNFRQAAQQKLQDLHATLAISHEEAERGTMRTLTLPGRRQIQVTIPALAQQGQILRLEGQGEATYDGGPRNALLLTIAVTDESSPKHLQDTNSNEPTAAAQNNDQEMAKQPIAPRPNSSGHVTSPSPLYNSSSSSFYPSTPGYNSGTPSGYPPSPIQRYDETITSHKYFEKNLVKEPPKLKLIGPVLLIVLFVLLASSGTLVYMNYTAQNHTQATRVATNGLRAASNATGTVVAAIAVTATTTEIRANPYVSGSSKLIIQNPLSQASSAWQIDPHDALGGSCVFTNSAYHVGETQKGYFRICGIKSTDVSDFVFEVHMHIVSGNCGGMLFRQLSSGQYYLYRVCQNGSYGLTRYVDNSGTTSVSMRYTTSKAIHQGSQDNVIAVVAQGTRIHLYVNNTDIDDFNDNNYLHGQLGLVADYSNAPADVAYTNARVWDLVV